ncbi:N6-adenosine-methyltransferase subunit METTL3 isoform X2 [Nematostella vectensis]|uniref:N6-adenosine-methyltransferase subunit METTL3 isoform X2 n=1 Tax=Nematostella vectensis TaxID=45351 RepID=UPI00138FDBB4|nr:N6-adenosine-methyltransferase subunit METTL3 isoform X2 [Nematostella vectensis]
MASSSTPPPSSPQSIEDSSSGKKQPEFVKVDPQLENSLIACLWDSTFIFPVDSVVITNHLKNQENAVNPTREAIQNLLEKLAIQDFICIKPGTAQDGRPCVIVTEKDHSKLDAVAQELNLADKTANTRKRKRESESSDAVKDVVPAKVKEETQDDLQKLLSQPTMKEQESKKVGLDILDLLNVPSHKEQGIAQKFKSQGGAFVHEFCEHGTHEDCRKNKKHGQPCKKVHFRKILQKHTDETLGDCSFLNTCFHMDTCKYVHYEVDYNDMAMKRKEEMEKDKLKDEVSSSKEDSGKIILYPPQWISCDVRSLQMDVLGKFSVIMADPPWDIHMELPYGTMSDDEMRNLSVPSLQDNGYIFLWVTGRAMELGRECLEIWGYERCDELIWVKTNQLQRLIRTGRTGHWINHGKEHCLIGVKGDTTGFNRGMDCDVLVAEVRETSHKPDEIYGLIERLSPGTRKIELFGRQHNVQPNWITLGNQLDGVRLLDPEVVARFKKRYPDGNPMTKKPS